MKASNFLVIAIAAILFSASHACFGQGYHYGYGYGGGGNSDSDYQSSFTIQLGAFIPSNGTIRNQLNSTWFTIGGEYAFANRPSDAFVPNLYIDSEFSSENYGYRFNNSYDLNLSTVGFGAGGKYYFNKKGNPNLTPYLGAGVGVYVNSSRLYSYYYNGSEGYDTTNGGFKVEAGLLFRQRLSLEAAYIDPGDLGGYNLGGTSITAGLRF